MPASAAPAATASAGGWSRESVLPLAAAVGIGLLPVALVGGPIGWALGPLLGLAAFAACRWVVRDPDRARPTRLPRWLARGLGLVRADGSVRTAQSRAARADPLRLASGWDLLAACLRGGLPVSVAVRSIAVELPAPAAEALRRTAELLALGADQEAAWEPALREPLTAGLARGARRSARSGAALAGVAETLAREVRDESDELAEARAQRVAVAVTGPLGLCFLPAFLCIGVIPVVIGLATRLVAGW